jgi:hypothetical protein
MQIKRKIKVVETAPCDHAMLVLEPVPFLLNKKVQNSPARKPLLRQSWGRKGRGWGTLQRKADGYHNEDLQCKECSSV